MRAISVRPWRFALIVLGGLCTELTVSSASNAQSLDPQKPAPLAPGINKGNVDSLQGAHYYYFWARPGHFNARIAFREMGSTGLLTGNR